MNVNRHMTIGGVPIKKVRDFLRKVSTLYSFDLDTLSSYFSMQNQTALELLNELYLQGYIDKEDTDQYVVSTKGNALSMVRFVPRINKIKADTIFHEFMERVNDVNTNDAYIYRVKQLILFGSYLDSFAKDYGDIDIAYELEPKINDREKFNKLRQKIISDAIKDGKQFRNFIEKMFYPKTLVIQYLRNRNCYISLHDMSDDILKEVSCKQIFP